MAFWIFMLVSDLIMPLFMIFFGRSYRKAPPAINDYEGYRTKRSKKSAQSWVYAHKYWGRLSEAAGIITLPLSAAPFMFVIGRDEETVGILGGAVCAAQIIFLLLIPIMATERALKRNFDAEGKPVTEKINK